MTLSAGQRTAARLRLQMSRRRFPGRPSLSSSPTARAQAVPADDGGERQPLVATEATSVSITRPMDFRYRGVRNHTTTAGRLTDVSSASTADPSTLTKGQQQTVEQELAASGSLPLRAAGASTASELILQFAYPDPTFAASSRQVKASQTTVKKELVITHTGSDGEAAVDASSPAAAAATDAQVLSEAEQKAVLRRKSSEKAKEMLEKKRNMSSDAQKKAKLLSPAAGASTASELILAKLLSAAAAKARHFALSAPKGGFAPALFPRLKAMPTSALSEKTLAARADFAEADIRGSLRRNRGSKYGTGSDASTLGLDSIDGWAELESATIVGADARKRLQRVESGTKRPVVPRLAHSLDRALFTPGVLLMRDMQTNAFNFDERLRVLPHPDEIDLKRMPAYITASKDEDLARLATETQSKYFGSTSTLTATLAHIWFLISRCKPLDLSSLTTAYDDQSSTHTRILTKPSAIILNYNAEKGTYGIDNDRTADGPGQQRILVNLGKVMEKMMTTTVEDMVRFRKDAPEEAVSHVERSAREAYHYTQGGLMLMRSQLDGYDERLPGTGIFDIKTRATASVRYDIDNHEEGQHYMLDKLVGNENSFERERYDMMRSAWLRYGLQCRIGGMDGIFVAYHSTRYMQGFEYIPLAEMDRVVYGDSNVAEQSFGISVNVLERIFEAATEIFPKESLSMILQTVKRSGELSVVFQPARDGVPKDEVPIAELRVQASDVCNTRHPDGSLEWEVRVKIVRRPESMTAATRAHLAILRARRDVFNREGRPLPTGKTEEEMQELYRRRWAEEVGDPEGEFASFGWRRATVEEARAEVRRASAGGAANTDDDLVELTDPLPMVRASPPVMRFVAPGKDRLRLRELSRLSKAREEALLAATTSAAAAAGGSVVGGDC